MYSLKSELTDLDTHKPDRKHKKLKPRRQRRAEARQKAKSDQRKIG
jgi:hypothetical protein